MIESGHKPIVLLGAGGHASVLLDILLSQGRELKAVVTAGGDSPSSSIFSGVRQLSDDGEVFQYPKEDVFLVNGLGISPRSYHRRSIVEKFSSKGYEFETIVSQHAIVSKYARLGEGVQILPGAIVQAGSSIGAHSILNSGAIVEHDCHIGTHNHIAPGAVLCGGVRTQTDVFVGAGSTVIQLVELGEKSIVGAAAVVNKTVLKGQVFYAAKSTCKD